MRKKICFLCGVFALLVCALIIALGLGRFDIAYSDMFALVREYFESSSKSIDSIIFVEERLKRIIAALCVGGALALSGGLYQGIIGNPLVSLGCHSTFPMRSFSRLLNSFMVKYTFQIIVFCGI